MGRDRSGLGLGCNLQNMFSIFEKISQVGWDGINVGVCVDLKDIINLVGGDTINWVGIIKGWGKVG